MKARRQINKQKKYDTIAKIHDKQEARYSKIREEIKHLSKPELQKLLISKQHSKTDRYAIIHAIKKIDNINPVEDTDKDGNTHNNNALSGEDTNIQ